MFVKKFTRDRAGWSVFSTDESKDTAKREELAIAVRYYFKNGVSERLIELNKLEEFDAPAIKCFQHFIAPFNLAASCVC